MSISILILLVIYLSKVHIIIIYMIYDLIKEINLVCERTLQFVQIMGSYGNKCSSPEKIEKNEITWRKIHSENLSFPWHEMTKSNIKISYKRKNNHN